MASNRDFGPSSDGANTTGTTSQSSSNEEYGRDLASPPYAAAGGNEGSPPGYQSRTNVSALANAPAQSGGAYDASAAYNNGVMGTAGAGAGDSKTGGARQQVPTAPTGIQAPRIAVTDPLADMRLRNLSKPEGLGANSDWPTRERFMASSQGFQQQQHSYPPSFNGGEPTASGGVTPRFDGLPPLGADGSLPMRPGFIRRDSEVSSDGGGGGYDEFDDGFNWSDDEAVEEAARFEEEIAAQRKVKIGRITLYSVFRFLAVTFLGNLIIGCLLIVPVLVIQFVYRPQTPSSDADALHRDYVADNIQAWFIWAAFNLHVSWWLHFLVGLVPRVGVTIVQFIWGTANQKVKSVAEFYGAIRQNIGPVTYAAMSWASWAILFNSIFGLYSHTDPKNLSRAKYLYRIYQVVQFLFFMTLTFCAEKILIKIIAMSFHKSAYAERIDKVTAALRAFDKLKDYRPKWRESTYRPYGYGTSGRTTPMAFSNSAQGKEGAAAGGVTPRSADQSPTTPMASLANAFSSNKQKHAKKRPQVSTPSHQAADMDFQQGKAGSVAPDGTYTPATSSGMARRRLAAIPGRAFKSGASTVRTTASRASKIARIALTDPFSLLSSKAVGVGADVNSPAAAKRLAKNIFRTFRGHHKRTYLIPSDFEPAFSTIAEAREAFTVFDRDGNGDISQSEIKNTVLATYKERRALSKSMQDVNHAVGQLERIFYIIVFIILMFEAFAIFDVDIGKTLTTFYTLGIAFAFIFKESAQNVFDSIIFLFVTHPFDTGDRIAITVGEDTMIMAVKRMSLLSSEFTLVDGTDLYVANSVLADIMISNYRRSGYQWECATMQVAFDTPLEALDKVENDMKHWLSTEPERMFEPSTAIIVQKIQYMRSIEITVGMTHRRTWQDWGMRWYCRNAFVAALCYYMKKHGVKYAAANQPIIYWTEDAAALPPSYNDAAGGHSSDTITEEEDGSPATLDPQRFGNRERRPSTTSELFSPYDDSFDQTPPPSPGPDGQQQTVPAPQTRKTFMGFSPPPDELDGTGLRRRKAKAKNKGVITQGGDG